MAFQIVLNSAWEPLGDSLESQVISFLKRIGYISENKTLEAVKKSVPFRLFMECFIKRRTKLWEIDEMETFLNATRATIYRHLNKLKSLDIVQEVPFNSKETGYIHKGYRLYYGDISRAWNFVEQHMDHTMKEYRESVNRIQEAMDKELSLEQELEE